MTTEFDEAAIHHVYRQGRLFPREVEATEIIEAPVDRVWRVLTDFASYPDWNEFTRGVDTTLRVGDPVDLAVDMPGRSRSLRREWVNRVEPGRVICWGMHMGHRMLMCANRWQELHDLGKGRTRYTTVDRFSGLLVPLMMPLYAEPMRRGFELVATGLKARCERAESSAGSGERNKEDDH